MVTVAVPPIAVRQSQLMYFAVIYKGNGPDGWQHFDGAEPFTARSGKNYAAFIYVGSVAPNLKQVPNAVSIELVEQSADGKWLIKWPDSY